MRLRFKGKVDLEAAKQAVMDAGLFPGGLTRTQVEILEFLTRQPKVKAGLSTIASALFEDPKDIQWEHERYLLYGEYIRVAPGGREITARGLAYLAAL